MLKKTFWIIAIVATILLSIPTTATFADNVVKVHIDNKPIYFDVEPQNIEGRILVPLRAIFEYLGAEVNWNGSTQTVTAIKDNTKITLQIDNTIANVNNKKVKLDVAAKNINGRTFVPARFIAESLGANVDWDGITNTVIIKNSDNNTSELDYYYFLYNSKRVTKGDLAAIKSYINKFSKTYNILKDVSQYDSAIDIYDALKSDSSNRKGQLIGIQLFGTSQDIPSFNYKNRFMFYDQTFKYSKIIGSDEVCKTDYFYSNFDNDSKIFNKALSIYEIFDQKCDISLVPKWKVARLPLTYGEIEGFIEKYYDYENKRKLQEKVPIICFSSPTYRQPSFYKHQGDDMSFFIERLAEDFKIIPRDNYRLYGNQRGLYKVNSSITGDITTENMHRENQKGIADFIFSGHGNPSRLTHTFSEINKKNNKEQEYGQPFLTDMTINTVLNKNYYTFFIWSCNAAHDLNNNNIVHEALVNGKCVNAIASSSILSSNGMQHDHESYDGYPDLNKLKENSPYYFAYSFYENMQKGKSRSDSFHAAKKAYCEELLKHMDLDMYESYQTNFINVFGFHYLGIFECDN